MTRLSSPLRHRRAVWKYVAVGSLVLLAVLIWQSGGKIESQVLLAAMSGLLGSAFFLYRGHADDARFMKELFEHFNGRYDKLNNTLQAILNEPKSHPLHDHEKMVIIDYFNLCAEEWVFYKAGYIYDPVWESWINGMRQYGEYECIAKLWASERETGSYYGFEFPS